MANPGRPRTASRELLRDAADELFIEQGFARTTVDEIAHRAGVSRGSFFNCFDAKADVLWVDVDDALRLVGRELGAARAERLADVFAALLRTAEAIPGDRVPLVATQSELIGAHDDLLASGLLRLARLRTVVRRAVCAALGRRHDDPEAQVVAGVLVGSIHAAYAGWARAGVGRRPLAAYVGDALAIVQRGTDAVVS